MTLTGLSYITFLLIVFGAYWSLPISWRKGFLLLISYAFYCSWKWQYGFLLFGMSLFNWGYGRWVLPNRKSSWFMTVGIAVNLIPLLYYKYTAFLLSNVNAGMAFLGWNWTIPLPAILLPLGISFFTFQGIAYIIDVALGEKPYTSSLDFLLYMAFWPKLIAGPIVRAREIQDQFSETRVVSFLDIKEGLGRIVLGLFKKIVIADSLAFAVDRIFDAPVASVMAMDAAIGLVGYGLQIYFDFSGYTDIAVGSARLFGYRLPENFDWPYMARSPQEFWNRWHISLSRWLRDYLFSPLTFAGRQYPVLMYLWFFVVMGICGLWHGAEWLFIIWGLWHGFLLALNHLISRRFFPSVKAPVRFLNLWDWLARGVTFGLVTLGWVFFRAQSLEQASAFLFNLFTLKGGLMPAVLDSHLTIVIVLAFLLLTIISMVYYFKQNAYPWLRWPAWIQAPFYITLVYLIFLCILVRMGGSEPRAQFIYFQF